MDYQVYQVNRGHQAHRDLQVCLDSREERETLDSQVLMDAQETKVCQGCPVRRVSEDLEQLDPPVQEENQVCLVSQVLLDQRESLVHQVKLLVPHPREKRDFQVCLVSLVMMVYQVSRVTQDNLDYLVYPDKMVSLVQSVKMVCLEPQANQDNLDYQVQGEIREPLDRLVCQVSLDHLEMMVYQAYLELKVTLEPLALAAMVQRDLQASLDKKEILDLLVSLALRVHLDHQDYQDRKEMLDFQVCLEFQVAKETPDPLVVQVKEVTLGSLDCLVLMDNLVCLDLREILVFLAWMVTLVSRDLLVMWVPLDHHAQRVSEV